MPIEQGRRCSTPTDRVLVAVSGGKDSLALWDVLIDLGYDTTGYPHRAVDGRGVRTGVARASRRRSPTRAA